VAKPLGIDAAIDQIEAAIFDSDEPTPDCELTIAEIGRRRSARNLRRPRLRKILKKLRVGYIKHMPIDSLCPHDIAVRKRLKK
jgi:hypothetical protein